MKFIKQYKFTIIVVILFIAVMVACFMLFGLFASGSEGGIYGTRLNDIKDVPISSGRKKEISDNVASLNRSSNVSVIVRGRIINVLITCNDDVNLNDAKDLSNKIVEKLSDDEKKLYDIQVFISKNNKEDLSFPIIGYRHHNKDGFSWNADR